MESRTDFKFHCCPSLGSKECLRSAWYTPCRHRLKCSKASSRKQRPRCSVHASASSNNVESPIIDVLLAYEHRNEAPFHIPGHKRGLGAPPELCRLFDRETLQYDLTELPGLDNLAAPSGPIQQSQEAAARAFGADHTWYLVNGTSVGLQAAVMATCGPRDFLLVARNCHASVSAAMVLADVQPLWLTPESDPMSDVAHGISPQELESKLLHAQAQGRAPKAALIVSPTYFGACSNIARLASICHNHGLPLIVDEAHGAHLGLQPGFPASAMQQGADVAVQSTHKTMNSLGQSSMLHARKGLVAPDRISKCLRLLQTTSPSYLLLASLDATQAFAQRGNFGLPLEAVSAAKKALLALPGISLLEHSYTGSSVACFDPWRITADVQQLGRTGFAVETELQDRFGIYPEMATHKVVVFALGPGTQQQHLYMLISGFTAICQEHVAAGTPRLEPTPRASVPEAKQSMAPRAAFFAEKELVRMEHAAGRISGDLICPYPPGVPVAFPGEEISAEVLDLLQSVIESGGIITGATDPTLQQLLVIKEAS